MAQNKLTISGATPSYDARRGYDWIIIPEGSGNVALTVTNLSLGAIQGVLYQHSTIGNRTLTINGISVPVNPAAGSSTWWGFGTDGVSELVTSNYGNATAPENTTPAAPTVIADDTANTLDFTHALGDSEILISVNNGAYTPFDGNVINVGDVARPQGYWKAKVKSADGRNESPVASSPAFNATASTNPLETLSVDRWYNSEDASSYTTRVVGADTFIPRLWNQKAKTGYPTSPQNDTYIQGTEAAQPKLIAAGINGKPSLELTSDPRWMATFSVQAINKPMIRWGVVQMKTMPGANRVLFDTGSSAANARVMVNAAGKLSVLSGGSSYLDGTSTIEVDVPFLIWVEFHTDGSTKVYKNNILEITGNAGGDAQAQLGILGRGDAACAHAWYGDFGDQYGIMSSSDRTAIANFLMNKWAI